MVITGNSAGTTGGQSLTCMHHRSLSQQEDAAVAQEAAEQQATAKVLQIQVTPQSESQAPVPPRAAMMREKVQAVRGTAAAVDADPVPRSLNLASQR
mmetsp:Transcript_35717/g.102710  ORF Transcript_35717/g.102710 Transcript_35717/m.102710 type:complete len:97 (-) Transcript_35717:813-1103(-)